MALDRVTLEPGDRREETMPIPNQHFLMLLERGVHPYCSSGERAVRLLAKAIVKHAGILDSEATQGLHEWIDLVQANPMAARDLLAEAY